jgi:lipoate-protein ligase A
MVQTEGAANILIQESKDVLLNLATEEYLYEHSVITNPVLFLWQNQKCVIIGKHQNPWKECNVPELEKDGVVLARRKSGGGCVYEDMGNAVFSFFNPISDFKTSNYKTMNNDVLIKTLEALGIPGAEPSGRNDIVIKDRKISGSAYKLNLGKSDGMGRKALHHGTMLLDVDFK